ncbi:linear amide C-N hydrolase [Paenibacillus sp. FSL H7-0326]|uniref:linear amide C-N hydrolase n=1 Tax=Paenibacillus sp. FSL H7-0326 TaxID=1921144 RepID=UPI0015C3C528|nr:linear amide C-N hydrolase [Paenibacillus sp. FSL H7-0326]
MPPDRPMKWISKYNSLTVSQVGKEMPNGGMNEAGLVVEQTTLWQSSYPNKEGLPAIGELQWIQLMLDTCASIEEVKETAESLQIVNPFSRLHYIICDRTGECAVFEFLNGELAIYSGSTLPVPVIVNTPYLETMVRLKSPGNTCPDGLNDYDLDSIKRFDRAVECLEYAATEVVDLNEMLRSTQRVDTAFSIVYNTATLEIQFESKRFPKQKRIRFQDIDFVSDSGIAVNIQQDKEVNFDLYSADLNQRIVEAFFRNPQLSTVFGSPLSDEVLTVIARFPESFRLR